MPTLPMEVGVDEARLRLLLALEIDRILRTLEERREALLGIWSRHRSREAILEVLFSRYRTLGLGELASLPGELVTALEAFYEPLDAFRLYVTWTEDMPNTLSERYAAALERLRARGEAALAVLDVEVG